MDFDGATYEPPFDRKRLTSMLIEVRSLMLDGEKRSLAQIHEAISRGSEASISARLRDLRKKKHGKYDVRGQRRGSLSQGVWEYWIVLPGSPGEGQLSLFKTGL